MASKTPINIKKSVKLVAGSIYDKERRRIYLKSMIDAEHAFIASKNRKFSDPATSLKSRDVPKD